MASFLSQLRRQPEGTKSRLVFLFSLAITFVIGMFWLTSFSAQLTEEKMADARGENGSGPLNELTGAVSLFTKESFAALRELKDLIPLGAE